MSNIKISLITVSFNAAATLDSCIESVIAQNYPNIEYIIIDGGSTDLSSSIIHKHQKHISSFISEPDNGIYDAMNKGITLATGDVIGILNADDQLTDANALADVAAAFEHADADIVYGDVDYLNNQGKIVRKWRSGNYKPGLFNWGWMPAHPAFYAKKELFNKAGLYKIEYGSATDYELMLRFIHVRGFTVYYINRVLVNMLMGGVSNKNMTNRLKAWKNDFKAMGNNGLKFPHVSLVLKPLRKIFQYLT